MAIDSIETSMASNDVQARPSPANRVPGTEAEPQSVPRSGMDSSHGGAKANRRRRPVFWMRQTAHDPDINAATGTSAQAIISEIEVCAARFAATGDIAAIDLRFLKAMPEEREKLSGLLGRGEVSVVVDALGRTEIWETAIPCVWWTSHRNSEGETVGELIEITSIPDVIPGDRGAIVPVLEALRTGRW